MSTTSFTCGKSPAVDIIGTSNSPMALGLLDAWRILMLHRKQPITKPCQLNGRLRTLLPACTEPDLLQYTTCRMAALPLTAACLGMFLSGDSRGSFLGFSAAPGLTPTRMCRMTKRPRRLLLRVTWFGLRHIEFT